MTAGAGPGPGSVRGREAGGWCARPAAGAATFPGDVPEPAEASRRRADLRSLRAREDGLPATTRGSVTSDAAAAIRHGCGRSFPHARSVRCRWHLARLAAGQAPPAARAPSDREARLAAAARGRRPSPPVSGPPDGLDEALAPRRPDGPAAHQRPHGLAERPPREVRRVLRAREAVRSRTAAPAWVTVAVGRRSARHRGTDRLPACLGAASGHRQRLTDFRAPVHPGWTATWASTRLDKNEPSVIIVLRRQRGEEEASHELPGVCKVGCEPACSGALPALLHRALRAAPGRS